MSMVGTWKFRRDWGCQGKNDAPFTVTFTEGKVRNYPIATYGAYNATGTGWTGKGTWVRIGETIFMSIPGSETGHITFAGRVTNTDNTVSGVFYLPWPPNTPQRNNSGCFSGVKVITTTKASPAKAKQGSTKKAAKKAGKQQAAKASKKRAAKKKR